MAKEPKYITGIEAATIIRNGGKAKRPAWNGHVQMHEDGVRLINRKPSDEDPAKEVEFNYFFVGEDLMADDWIQID